MNSSEITKITADFLLIQGWFEAQQFVHEHPELISDDVNRHLDRLIAFAISQNNQEMRPFLEQRLTLLKRCREIGIEQAFGEFFKYVARVSDATDFVESLDPEALTQVLNWWLGILTHPNYADLSESFKWSVLNTCARGLMQRYGVFDQPDDLDRAIELFEKGTQLTTPASFEHANFTNNLATSLRARYRHSGDPEDVSQAITYLREALSYYKKNVELASTNTRELAALLNNLADALYTYYGCTGNLADINEAIEHNQRAIDLNVDRPSFRANCQTVRGNCYRLRYFHTGDLTNLDKFTDAYRKALGYHQQAFELSPTVAPDRAGTLSNLGVALRERYLHTNNPEELDEAIKYSQAAVDLTSKESPLQGSFLNNLGNGLRSRYSHTGNPDDLDEAIKYYRQAVDRSRADSFDMAFSLDNVGNGLRDRYRRTGQLADLDEAIKYYREALKYVSTTSPERPRHLNNLAHALDERYARSNDFALLEEAFSLHQQACEQGLNLNPQVSLLGSQSWGSQAMMQSAWKEAARAFGYGLQASDQLFRGQLLRAHKESWLQKAQRLHTHAAYTLIHNGDLVSAVQILEEGRARLLADAVERKRTDLENLPALGYQNLYEQYRSASEKLDQFEKIELSQDGVSHNFNLSAEMSAARAELDAAIESIQQIPKYETFFRSPTFDVVQRTLTGSRDTDRTEESAGVYLMVTIAGGAAVIVHAGGVESLWLDFDEADLNSLLVERDVERIVGGYLYGQFSPSSMEPILDQVLSLIGEKIMGPIANALHKLFHFKNSEKPRVVLIPTGRLSLLPLHAARYQISGKSQDFLDDFTVTYTPSARVLRHSRHTLGSLSNDPPSLLGISNPLPLSDGLTSLTFAQTEIEEIAKLFGVRAKLISQTQATVSAVEGELESNTYLHFACHGQFNPLKPLASGLILSNGERLTLSHVLARSNLETTRLVTLSACQTAITDWNYLPEETVGLPSGFLQAGAPAVIGSLWPVNDLSTALLMIKFYEFHFGHSPTGAQKPMDAAYALRQAQLWLRDVTNHKLKNLFNDYAQVTPDPPGNSYIPDALAKEKFGETNFGDPDDRPYSHPFYWAAFAFYGI